MNDDEPDDVEAPPPTAERVLRRTWALASVAWRAIGEETDDPEHAATGLAELRAWVADVGLDDELEDSEREILRLELGALKGRSLFQASWRTEGVSVLAWALGICDLPDHQTCCDGFSVFPSLGFLEPRPTNAKPPTLRTPDEIEWQSLRLLGLHWRLRDFSLSPRAIDFRALATGKIWFGGFDLAGIPLVDNDLAIDGRAIVDADPALVRRCMSIAMERHQAIRWLEGATEIYSEVDTST